MYRHLHRLVELRIDTERDVVSGRLGTRSQQCSALLHDEFDDYRVGSLDRTDGDLAVARGGMRIPREKHSARIKTRQIQRRPRHELLAVQIAAERPWRA